MARIDYIDVDNATENVKRVFAGLPRPLNIFRLAAHAERCLRPLVGLGAAILGKSKLDPRLRELAILQVAHLSGAQYEWTQHEALALHVGATSAEVLAIAEGRPVELPERAARVVAFTTEVVRDVRASDEAFDAVREFLDEREIVELVIAIGYYMSLARLMVTLDVDAEPAVGAELIETIR